MSLVCLGFRSSRTRWSQVEKPSGEEGVPASGAPLVAFCPPSFGLAGGRIEASTQCGRELSACYTMVVPRMFSAIGTHHPSRGWRVPATLLAVLMPNRIIHKHTVFLGSSNPQGQRQTSTLSIPRDNIRESKAKFILETSRTTQMQLYKCIHVP
jgi:hypothetical protein